MQRESQHELDRYSRQVILPGIGPDGQRKLLNARVAVVGCGALGCAAIDLLARAGVASLGLIDRDVVEETNLQRQCLFTEADAHEGAPKAVAAARRVAQINSGVQCESHIRDLTFDSAEDLILSPRRPDLILDGTDNLETRYLLNDLAVKHAIPLVYGGVIARRGMQMTVRPHPGPHATPCLRCVFPEPSSQIETCDTAGVLGPAVSIVASLQAAAAIEIILDSVPHPPALTEFDLGSGRFRTIDLSTLSSVRPGCICCGQRRYEYLSGEKARPAVSLCGRGAFQIPAGSEAIDLASLASRAARISSVRATEFFVRVAPKDGVEMTVFADARAVVRGVANEGEARALYDRIVGA
ncbi:MAG: ThiF family adenylyltransferase [Phycisphaerales bacterium]|nr:ThiF family adenylyltransferase [Planctomycetota bacterium]